MSESRSTQRPTIISESASPQGPAGACGNIRARLALCRLVRCSKIYAYSIASSVHDSRALTFVNGSVGLPQHNVMLEARRWRMRGSRGRHVLRIRRSGCLSHPAYCLDGMRRRASKRTMCAIPGPAPPAASPARRWRENCWMRADSRACVTLITLRVEFDASGRAQQLLMSQGIIRGEQQVEGIEKVLGAAAWTYVAGAVSSVRSFFYFAYMSTRWSAAHRQPRLDVGFGRCAEFCVGGRARGCRRSRPHPPLIDQEAREHCEADRYVSASGPQRADSAPKSSRLRRLPTAQR